MLGLGLELYFRSQPDYGRTGYTFDQHLIYRLNPGLSAQKAHAWGKTGLPPFALTFNNKGFRGADFTNQKKEETIRVLVIGDSYTAGLDYPDDHIFTSQWENYLNQSGQYEVLNASCPAWGTDQYYVYWKTEGKALKPDHVILMYSPNDLREMWNHGIVRLDPQQNKIVSKKASLPRGQYWGWALATRSSLYQFLQKKVFHTDHGNFLKIFHHYPVNYGIMDSTDWDMPLFLKEPFAEVEQSYDLLERLLVDIQEDCLAIGATLHVVKIPIRLEMDNTYQDSIFSKTIVEERIQQIANRNQILYYNLNDHIRQDSIGQGIFMSWEYHYNQAGHDWIAQALSEKISLGNRLK